MECCDFLGSGAASCTSHVQEMHVVWPPLVDILCRKQNNRTSRFFNCYQLSAGQEGCFSLRHALPFGQNIKLSAKEPMEGEIGSIHICLLLLKGTQLFFLPLGEFLEAEGNVALDGFMNICFKTKAPEFSFSLHP